MLIDPSRHPPHPPAKPAFHQKLLVVKSLDSSCPPFLSSALSLACGALKYVETLHDQLQLRGHRQDRPCITTKNCGEVFFFLASYSFQSPDPPFSLSLSLPTPPPAKKRDGAEQGRGRGRSYMPILRLGAFPGLHKSTLSLRPATAVLVHKDPRRPAQTRATFSPLCSSPLHQRTQLQLSC